MTYSKKMSLLVINKSEAIFVKYFQEKFILDIIYFLIDVQNIYRVSL